MPTNIYICSLVDDNIYKTNVFEKRRK